MGADDIWVLEGLEGCVGRRGLMGGDVVSRIGFFEGSRFGRGAIGRSGWFSRAYARWV